MGTGLNLDHRVSYLWILYLSIQSFVGYLSEARSMDG